MENVVCDGSVVPNETPREKALQAELEAVRAVASKREEELTRMVAKAKEIFDVNLSHESARLERKYQALLDEKQVEVASAKNLIQLREDTIAALSLRVAVFEEEKLAALREQKQSVMLVSELANSDLEQSRAVAEKQRYEFEKMNERHEKNLQQVRQTLEASQACALEFQRLRLVDVAWMENLGRDYLLRSEMNARSQNLLFFNQLRQADAFREIAEQIAFKKIYDAVTEGIARRPHLPQLDASNDAAHTVDTVTQFIRNAYEVQLEAQDETISNANQAINSLRLDCESSRLECFQLSENLTNFEKQTSKRIEFFNESLHRFEEMQTRLKTTFDRRRVATETSAAAIDQVSAAYEEEIKALKDAIAGHERTISEMVPKETFDALKAQLSTAQQALSVVRDELDAIKSVPAENACIPKQVNAVAEGDAGSEAPNDQADPFSRWTNPAKASATTLAVVEHDSSLSDRKTDQEELILLRKELSAARATIVDLKSLVRKLKDKSSNSTIDPPLLQQQGDQAPHTARPSTAEHDDVPAVRVMSSARDQGPNAAESELHMQVFTLRRERDAWKRKADAALAQASHAEEQRLASVYTYLQLVGRKEEEYAHTILSGGRNVSVGHTEPPQKRDERQDSFMPGGAVQSGGSTALAEVMKDVRIRGEQRAERWLADKADELKAQASQLNRLRDELALKASSLARREEALQHEKTGLMLKKGGVGRVSAGGLLIGSAPDSHQEPLRETVPPVRLRPMLNVSLPQNTAKQDHPQRYVLAPLANPARK